MSDEPTPRSTGKARVRNQGNRFKQSLPNECRSWREHFRHAGATLRTFVSDNDDFPNLDLVAEDRLDDILLRIEDPSGPDEASLFDPRSFRNAAIGREIVNRLPRLTPAFSDKSTSWRADRRSDPTPSDRQRQSVCEHWPQASNPR